LTTGSTNHQVPALRPPALLVAPGLAPGAGRPHLAPSPPPGANGEHWRSIQRGRIPRREAAPRSQPSPWRQWRALALHPTWAGARPMASTQKVVEHWLPDHLTGKHLRNI